MLGVVANGPVVSWSRGGVRTAFKALTIILVLSDTCTNREVVRWMLLGLLLLFVFRLILSRLGLRGSLSLSFLISLLVTGLFLRTRSERPALVFRESSVAGLVNVRMGGHDAGLQLHDQVEVSGFSVNGTVHAWRIRNLTTHAVLYDRGLCSLSLMLALDSALIALFVVQMRGI